MGPKVKTVEKLVRLLKDPEPVFISIVDHGANQTPFTTLKHNDEEGVGEMAIRKRHAEPTSVRKLTFAKASFKDEASVKGWLKKNNWAGDYAITTETGVFVVADKGVSDDQFEGVIRKVATSTEGVSGWVGVLKAGQTRDDINSPGDDTGNADDQGEGEGADASPDEAGENNGSNKTTKVAKKKPGAAVQDDGENQDAGTGGGEGPATTTAAKVDGAVEGDYGAHDQAHYADPGYQKDKKPRYPLMKGGVWSEERIRAAWSYINVTANADKYSGADRDRIKANITSAWKEHIDPAGPPEAEEGKTTVAKMDWWSLYTTEQTSLGEVIEDGMSDGVPPGMCEVVQCMAAAMANVILDDDIADTETAIKQVGIEAGNYIAGLYTLFKSFDIDPAKKAALIKSAGIQAVHIPILEKASKRFFSQIKIMTEKKMLLLPKDSDWDDGYTQDTGDGVAATGIKPKTNATDNGEFDDGYTSEEGDGTDAAGVPTGSRNNGESPIGAGQPGGGNAKPGSTTSKVSVATGEGASRADEQVSEEDRRTADITTAKALQSIATTLGNMQKSIDGISKKSDDAVTLAKDAKEQAIKAASLAGKRAPTPKASQEQGGSDGAQSVDKTDTEKKAVKLSELKSTLGF